MLQGERQVRGMLELWMGGKIRYNTRQLSFLRRPPVPLHAAIDSGLTNVDAVLRDRDGKLHTYLLPGNYQPVTAQLEAVLELFGHPLANFEWIAVTGGQFRQLPPALGAVRLVPVKEVPAIGRGGLRL